MLFCAGIMENERKKRVALTTLGCKANWSDTESMAQALRAAGFDIVGFEEESDAYVVNTCAVTDSASAQSRQMARRATRRGGGPLLVVTGCLGELSRDELSSAVGADAVFGTRDRVGVVDYLKEKLLGESGTDEVSAGSAFGLQPLSAQSRARAFLKIQDGCGRSCAYCVIPAARGRPTSLASDKVMEACKGLSKFHNEIILTGIDIGQYADDGTNLCDLLDELVRIPNMARLRLSSLDPTRIDERLVDLMANSGRICRHLHMSIQSGSKEVIHRMGRAYGPDDIERSMAMLINAIPDIAITGDVIAGFPGESVGEHEETVDLLKRLPIAGLHVFPFSLRSGTRAAQMADQISKEEKKRRAAAIRDIATSARARYLKSLIGEKLEVVVTSVDADGNVSAFADNAVVVEVPTGGQKIGYGGIENVTVEEITVGGLRGKWDLQKKTRIG
jgi:threonylcarbamoyladenosine tRNA methylthiotransferase MtaB